MSNWVVTLVLVLLTVTAVSAWAEKTTKIEVERAAPGAGLTIYMDISVMSRKHRAAKRMTALHKEHFAQGWTVVDIDPYIENGDLQGFFITYIGRVMEE